MRGAVAVVAADERSADDSPEVTVDVDRWGLLARLAAEAEGATGELTLTFVDAADIADLNAEHMGVSGPTDVLSFPIDDDPDGVLAGAPRLLGDIVVSPRVAAAQFGEHAGTLDDELALLVVHGVLHVLGHDHADPDETELMRARELALLVDHHWHGPPPPAFRQTHS